MNPEERTQLIVEVADKLYEETESFEPIALDIAYLFVAIAKGDTIVEWDEPDPGDGPYENTVKLFRNLFPSEHPVWNYIIVI